MLVVSTQAYSVAGVEVDTECAPGQASAEAATVTNASGPDGGAETSNTTPLGVLVTSNDALGKGGCGGPPGRGVVNEGPVTVKAFCPSTVPAKPSISTASTNDDPRME